MQSPSFACLNLNSWTWKALSVCHYEKCSTVSVISLPCIQIEQILLFAIGCQFPPNILGRFFELDLKERLGGVVSCHLVRSPQPDGSRALSVSGSQLVTIHVQQQRLL